jgi:drug/metabolite transporter (DMT)-like permease
LAIELTGSAAVLLVVAAATGRLHRRGARRALVQGAVLPGLSFLLGDLGLARTTATSGALLLSVDAVATVLFAALFLKERVSAVARVALALGTAGTALVALYAPGGGSTPTFGSELLGNLLVLVSVIGSAGFVVWSRRTAQPGEEGLPAEEGVGRTAWQFLGATLAVSPFVLGSWWTGGSRITTADPHQLAAAAAVLLCGLSALLAFNIGIGAVSASRAGLLFTLQPLAGAARTMSQLADDGLLPRFLSRRIKATDCPWAATALTAGSQADIIDDRLTRKVTLALKATALSDLCDQLRSETGIHLTAGSSVADEKVTDFVSEQAMEEDVLLFKGGKRNNVERSLHLLQNFTFEINSRHIFAIRLEVPTIDVSLVDHMERIVVAPHRTQHDLDVG